MESVQSNCLHKPFVKDLSSLQSEMCSHNKLIMCLQLSAGTHIYLLQ